MLLSSKIFRKIGEPMLQQLVNGLILGSVYALLALVIPWCTELSNSLTSHGDLYMMGAFMGYFLLNNLTFIADGGMRFFVALILAMVGTAILGVVIEF